MSSTSRKLIQASGAVAGPADTGDDDFANVVLLLDGDGTSGDDNNTFTDSSTNNLTASPDGSVVQGSFSPYGDNWSNYFDGSSTILDVSGHAGLNFGSGDFTLECFVSLNSNGSTYQAITDPRSSASDNVPLLWIHNTGVVYYYAGGSQRILGTTVLNTNQWYHVALVKNSGTTTLYLDGSSEGSFSDSLTYIEPTTFRIGQRYASGTYTLDGYLSNLRALKGTAVYTSTFTPPTDPLTAITNTQLLTCQSNRFVDNSTNNSTITISGTPKVTPFSPFKNDDARDITTDGGSAYFDGGDHDIQWGASGDLALGSGDWSVETWYYMNALPTGVVGNFIDWRTFGSNPANVPILNLSPSGYMNWYASVGVGIVITSNIPLKTNEWTHIAIAKNGSTTTMYFNGTSVGTYTDSRTYAAEIFGMGNIQTLYGVDSYYSDLRILIGSTAYTGAFTPPTAPLTAVTNTKLLTNFQDSGIYDRTGLNNIDTVGDAQIDTAVKKYGTGSMEFDGTGDELLAKEQAESLTFGTGDFTVEFWVYLDSVSGTQNLIDWRNAGGDQGNYITLYTSGNTLNFFVAGSNLLNGTVSSSAWQHIALTKENSTTRLFINGSQSGSNLSDSTSYLKPQNGYLHVGGLNGSVPLDGYIDDLRITKGVARYTANFTAPDAALPKF